NGDTVGVLSGSPSLTTTAPANNPVGSYTITAALGSLNAANYNFTFVTGTLTVSKAALTIKANDQSKTYGATLTLGTSAFTATGLQNSETVGSVSLTASGGTAATDAAGSYTITPSAAAAGTFNANNYTITYQTGTLTVNKATLDITANDVKTY